MSYYDTDSKTLDYKLVLLGETCVGKSSLVFRFVKDQFFEDNLSTIGAAYLPSTIKYNEYTIKFDIWDTAGQERFHSLAHMYYKDAKAAIVVFDLTKKGTFARAQTWVKELQSSGDSEVVIALAGNKCDLDGREIDANVAKEYAEDNNIFYMETSAKTNTNITEIFQEIAKRLPKHNKDDDEDIVDPDDEDPVKKKNCCVLL